VLQYSVGKLMESIIETATDCLQAQTTRVVFSWNDVDPTTPDGSDARQHQTRGAASVNLLGGLPNPPPAPTDSEDFFIGVNSVSVI